MPASAPSREVSRRLLRRLLAALALVLAGAALIGASALPGAADPEVGWEPLADGETLITDRSEILELLGREWTGTWGAILFESDASGRLGGAYDFDIGVLIGSLRGPYVVGWWCEAPTYQGVNDSGELQFRFVRTPDGSARIDGRWTYDELDDQEWNGDWDNQEATIPTPDAVRGRVTQAFALCSAPFPLSGTLGIDEPSTLSGLRPAQEVTPVAVAAAGGGAVVLVALAAAPTALLNGTLRANGPRLFGWTAPVRRRFSRVSAALRRRVPSWLPVVLGLLAALLISGFVDPRFGTGLGSLRLLASLAVAVLVEQLAFLLLARNVIRSRLPAAAPTVSFTLGTLVFVAVAVLLTRVTGFQPGIVFGLVLGLSFAVALGRRGEAGLALATSGWALALGLVGWGGFSLLNAALPADPGVVWLFALETLSGFAVSGLAALPIALLPIADLEGSAIWRWNRWAWATCYVVCLAVFFIVVLPFPSSWAEVPSLTPWIVLFVSYCVLAVAVWALFRFAIGKPREPAGSAPDSPAADEPTDVGGRP